MSTVNRKNSIMANRQQTMKQGAKVGMRDALPFILVAAPFGLLFGVVGTEAGLNLLEVMTMTTLVIAGASQFTAVALWVEEAPTIIAIVTALAVNLRMAMYSAALVPHFRGAPMRLRLLKGYALVDQNFALTDGKFSGDFETPWEFKSGYFFAGFCTIAPFWISFTYIGAVFGTRIPPEYAIDFALPIMFLALIGPMLRSIPHYVAAIVSIVFALLLDDVPFGLGLLIAAFIAIVVASMTEVWMERRAK